MGRDPKTELHTQSGATGANNLHARKSGEQAHRFPPSPPIPPIPPIPKGEVTNQKSAGTRRDLPQPTLYRPVKAGKASQRLASTGVAYCAQTRKRNPPGPDHRAPAWVPAHERAEGVFLALQAQYVRPISATQARERFPCMETREETRK